MKKIANFDSVKPYIDVEKLPVGAYVVKLMKGARVEATPYEACFFHQRKDRRSNSFL